MHIRSRCKLAAQTGVEMEALTAVSVAALTIYDMCKDSGQGYAYRQHPPAQQKRWPLRRLAGAGEGWFMITLLFFAKLREELGTASMQLEFSGSVAELKTQLAGRGPEWAEALCKENLRCAVNQAVASEEAGGCCRG